jgi:predicted PurR-regulated permease PerM
MAPLTPYQRQAALWLGIGIAFVLVLWLLGPILTPFIAGGVLAYALDPIVERICKLHIGTHRIPRFIGVLAVLIMLIAVVSAIILIIVPLILTEWPLLSAQLPVFLTKLHTELSAFLGRFGITIPADTASFLQAVYEQFLPRSDEGWNQLLQRIKLGWSTIFTIAWNIILIPVVFIYLLLDWHKITRHVRELIPRRWLPSIIGFTNEVSTMLAQYLRGQIAVMLILSVYYSVALSLAGYNVAIPVGIITGMMAFVPYVGICVGVMLAAAATLLQFEGMTMWMVLLLIYGFGYAFDGLFMTPKLVGDRIQLHPLIVIFALLAFGQLFGFVGILIALPSSAILSVAFRRLRKAYIASHFYKG